MPDEARDLADPPGLMPWPLTREELTSFFEVLHEESFEDYFDNEAPTVRRFRISYRC